MPKTLRRKTCWSAFTNGLRQLNPKNLFIYCLLLSAHAAVAVERNFQPLNLLDFEVDLGKDWGQKDCIQSAEDCYLSVMPLAMSNEKFSIAQVCDDDPMPAPTSSVSKGIFYGQDFCHKRVLAINGEKGGRLKLTEIDFNTPSGTYALRERFFPAPSASDPNCPQMNKLTVQVVSEATGRVLREGSTVPIVNQFNEREICRPSIKV